MARSFASFANGSANVGLIGRAATGERIDLLVWDARFCGIGGGRNFRIGSLIQVVLIIALWGFSSSAGQLRDYRIRSLAAGVMANDGTVAGATAQVVTPLRAWPSPRIAA